MVGIRIEWLPGYNNRRVDDELSDLSCGIFESRQYVEK